MKFNNMRRQLCAIVFFAMIVARPAFAQRADTTVVDTVKHGVSPGKAFLRSALIPGWGQLSVHANKRAAVFIALQSTSYFMLAKTLNKLSDAKDKEAGARTVFGDSLRGLMQRDTALNRRLSNADTFRAAVDTAGIVTAAASLANSRREQRQDWIAYTLFLTLASGVDAFVAAHLADFPAVITTRPNVPARSVELRFTVPLKRH